MGFLGGWKWETNPQLDPALAGLQSAQDETGNMHSAANRFARNILKGLQSGDSTLIGNPFLAQQAANNRLSAANMDPFLPPEIASARQNLAESRNAETAGQNFENYARGMAGQAMQTNLQQKMFKTSERNRLAEAMARARLEGVQGRQTQGWGGMLLGGLSAAAGAASGLGWSPFGKG